MEAEYRNCPVQLALLILNYASFVYWLTFLTVWLYKTLTAEHAPCGRLHQAIAIVVFMRLASKLLAVPWLSKCNGDSLEHSFAYLSEQVIWALIFALGIIICRGYGITHWSVRTKTVLTTIALTSGIAILGIVPVATGFAPYSLLPFLYFQLVYTYQLYLGVRTLRTLSQVKKHIIDFRDLPQLQPVKDRQRILIVIMVFLLIVYIFTWILFVFALANYLDSSISEMNNIRDVVMICLEPPLNTIIYYEVRPKVQDSDLQYRVDPDRPFDFQPVIPTESYGQILLEAT